MNNHATRLGLAGVNGSSWNSSCVHKYPPIWHRSLPPGIADLAAQIWAIVRREVARCE
jgi:hypothetical protein